MAVLEQEVVVANFDATDQWSIAARSGAAPGKPIVVTICLSNAQAHANMVTVPSGFTLISEEGDDGNVAYILKYLKASSGSESGTYDFIGSVSTWGTIAAMWLDGADDADPIDVFAGANNGTGSGSTATAPSVTTTEDGALIDRTFADRNGASTVTLSVDRTLWNAGERSACGVQDQGTAGATGTNDATLTAASRWAAMTVAYKPSTEVEPTERLQPKVITRLPVALEDLAVQTTSEQADEIRIVPPEGEGTVSDERTVLVIHCRDHLPASAIVGKPATSTDLVEANDPEVTGASVLGCLMPVGHVQSGNYVFSVDPLHDLPSPRIIAYALRVRWVHPTVHHAATPLFNAQGSSDPVGSPDGLVRFPAITPDATALKSLRLCLGTARRTGVWTMDPSLTRVHPGTDEGSYHAAGYEDWAVTTEAPERTAEHDDPLEPPDRYYGRVGLSWLLQGAPDYGRPGAPDHTGTEAVSWASAKLVATDPGTPQAATSIEVYRHTASMAGDPETNGTLVRTFAPSGTAVDDGLAAETAYFYQLVAKNAEGSTLGEEFRVTTWRQAAYVLDEAQTMVVPMTIDEFGIANKEYRGSDLNSTSWDYEHPGGSLLVFVGAFDPVELAEITGVTADAVAMDVGRIVESPPSSGGGYIASGAFFLADVAAGTITLAVTTSGGSPEVPRWQVYSLSGPSVELVFVGFFGSSTFTTTKGSVVATNDAEEGDLLIDFLAWRNSAIGIASIGEDQTQELADNAPTRMNGTSRVRPSTAVMMTQFPDDDSPTNCRIHHAAILRSSGGVGTTMRALRVDIGRAALTDADLTTNPSVLIEIFDESAVKVGERTITDLELIGDGVQELVTTSELVAPQTIEIHLTNTGRVPAIWGLLGLEPGFVAHDAATSDAGPAQTDAATATYEEAPIPAPADLTATAVTGPAVDLAWTPADPTLQTRIYRRRIS